MQLLAWPLFELFVLLAVSQGSILQWFGVQALKELQELTKDDPVSPFWRKWFTCASCLYPLGGIVALSYMATALYYLYSGIAPLSTPGLDMFISFIPYYVCKWALAYCGNTMLDNPLDGLRAQQTWFAYAIVYCVAIYQAFQVCHRGYWLVCLRHGSVCVCVCVCARSCARKCLRSGHQAAPPWRT